MALAANLTLQIYAFRLKISRNQRGVSSTDWYYEPGDSFYDELNQADVDQQGGYPFFGQLILDCLDRTETAMTQAHAFAAAELCLRAQARAEQAG